MMKSLAGQSSNAGFPV